MFEFLAAILSFFYQFTHSYGLSIVLLTVVVRLVLFPTHGQTDALHGRHEPGSATN